MLPADRSRYDIGSSDVLLPATPRFADAEFSGDLDGLNKLIDPVSVMLGRRGVDCDSEASQNGSLEAFFSPPRTPGLSSSGGLPRRQRAALDFSSFFVEVFPRPCSPLSCFDLGIAEEDGNVNITLPGDVGSTEPFGDDGLLLASDADGLGNSSANTSWDDGSLLPRRPGRILATPDCC